jgi:hypothetical protein
MPAPILLISNEAHPIAPLLASQRPPSRSNLEMTNMNTAFSDIFLGVKRSIGLMSRRDKQRLSVATFIMLITGILANGPP